MAHELDARAPSISVVIVTRNEGPVLLRCLRSLARDRDETVEAIVVNNGDDIPELAEARAHPFVTVLPAGGNVGFAGACNIGARAARAPVLVFLNPDTVVASGAMRELARTLEDRSVGLVTARLRLLRTPELLNAAGGELHPTGLAWARDYGEPVERASETRDVAFPSGAAMAIRAELFEELGRLNDRFFIYHEDVELGWRAHMRGLRVLMNPAADVYHDYEFVRNPRKLYLLERNRLVFVLSSFSGRTLAVVAPLVLAAEVAMLVLAIREGWWRDKLASWAWCARNAGWVARHRRETQRLRRVPDRELARLLTPEIAPAMISVPAVIRAANPLLRAYWALARHAL